MAKDAERSDHSVVPLGGLGKRYLKVSITANYDAEHTQTVERDCPALPVSTHRSSARRATSLGLLCGDLPQQWRDPAHRGAAVGLFGQWRVDFQELLAVALHHQIFRRDAKGFGQRQSHAFRTPV